MQVNAIKQRAGNLGYVAFYYARTADAFFVGMVVVATGAGLRCIVVKYN